MRLLGWEIKRVNGESIPESIGCQDCEFDAVAMEDMRKRLQRIERLVYRNRQRYPDDSQDNSDLAWLHSLKAKAE